MGMLVLSRHRDEVINIGGEIEIQVVEIRGDKVRLGITAPKNVSVHRKEVFDAIQREEKAKLEAELKANGGQDEAAEQIDESEVEPPRTY